MPASSRESNHPGTAHGPSRPRPSGGRRETALRTPPPGFGVGAARRSPRKTPAMAGAVDGYRSCFTAFLAAPLTAEFANDAADQLGRFFALQGQLAFQLVR